MDGVTHVVQSVLCLSIYLTEASLMNTLICGVNLWPSSVLNAMYVSYYNDTLHACLRAYACKEAAMTAAWAAREFAAMPRGHGQGSYWRGKSKGNKGKGKAKGKKGKSKWGRYKGKGGAGAPPPPPPPPPPVPPVLKPAPKARPQSAPEGKANRGPTQPARAPPTRLVVQARGPKPPAAAPPTRLVARAWGSVASFVEEREETRHEG